MNPVAKIGILTISDRASRGDYADEGGPEQGRTQEITNRVRYWGPGGTWVYRGCLASLGKPEWGFGDDPEGEDAQGRRHSGEVKEPAPGLRGHGPEPGDLRQSKDASVEGGPHEAGDAEHLARMQIERGPKP